MLRIPRASVSPTLAAAVLLGGSVLPAASGAQGTAPAQQVREIRAMRYPGISPDGKQIVFTYRGDLWLVGSGGGMATRVAEMPGWDVRARFSPDGKTLAYCTDRNGNMDIYTIPVTGGTARRVTHHTADDLLGDWTQDGKGLLFYSTRDTRTASVYLIHLEDGRLRQLSFDEQVLQNPVASPDGTLVAYSRGRAEWARKGYVGAANGEIYVGSITDPRTPPRRLTNTLRHDIWPMFSPDGKSLYYVTDTDGVGNLWRVPTRGGRPVQVSKQRDGYIHYPCISRDGSRIVYETDFSLWVIDPRERNARPARLNVQASLPPAAEMVERRLDGRATELEISPDGKSLLLTVRGDLLLVPATGGEGKRLTDSLAQDYDTAWSPDGKQIAFVSEREANSDIYLLDVASGSTRRVTTHPDPEVSPQFSPDGRELLFLRGANGREVISVPAGGGSERILVAGGFINSPRWSPDGKWIAYSRRTQAAITNVFVAPVAGGREINVSRWSGSNSSPLWCPDGRHLAFTSTRGGAPDTYLVRLDRPGATTAGTTPPAAAAPQVAIDPEEIERRVRALSGEPAGSKSNANFLPDGKTCIYTAGTTVYSVPIEGGRPTKIADNFGGSLRLSSDGATLYALQFPQGSIRSLPRAGGTAQEIRYTASFKYDAMEDRRQTFDQAWRLLRDNFYDPSMHGRDWAAIRNKYRPIVDECVDVNEFHLLLNEMNGELNASHMGATRGGQAGGRGGGGGGGNTSTGGLGVWIDWEHPGPGLKVASILRRGPADTDESRIRPGEYILSIAGKDVFPREGLFETLNGTSGRKLEVLVNTRPEKEGARKVSLTPSRQQEFATQFYEHWVAERREAVKRLSGGRLSYLHIRSMDQASLSRFERELLTEAYDSEGMVLDIRFNGGGRIHDELLAILARRVHAYETPREGLKMTQPFGAFYRPSILVINESCFSDAEIFPNGYRNNGHGKLVGMTTGGGVIGTNNRGLLDGLTTFRVPTTGWVDLRGKNLENSGVAPDIRVPMEPVDLLAGRDPQLERAVAELLKKLPRQVARSK